MFNQTLVLVRQSLTTHVVYCLTMSKSILLLCVMTLLVSGCQSTPQQSTAKKAEQGGAYYLDDRPPAAEEYRRNIASIPDAVPRNEPLSRYGNAPYTALNKRYYPLKTARGYDQTGKASWYGMRYHGNRTSSGETYDVWKMTAAHPTLPLPSYVEVTNLDNGRKVVVKVNDRGPFLHGRIIDLSYVAARKLGIVEQGTGRVRVRTVGPGENSARLTSTSTTPARQYLIQLGVFGVRDNALAMRRQLAAMNYTVYPENFETFLSRGAPYKVQVGPFANLDQVYAAKDQLELSLQQQVSIIALD